MTLAAAMVYVCVVPGLWAQLQQTQPQPPSVTDFSINRPSQTPTSLDGNEYRIGQEDLIEVTVFEIPELGSTTRVTASGDASLPLIGPIQALGKTPQELAGAIEAALKIKYVNEPHVQVFIREYASQPVSVIGAVKVPGIYQLKGQKFLIDVLAMAQGPSDTVGKTIQVMRRQTRSDEKADTISINVEDLFQNGRAELNIPIRPGDVINVLNAGSIFAVGEFLRPGEFVLRYGKDVTVARTVALGGGLTKEAQKKESVIIRPHADGTQEQIPVNIAKILDGTAEDIRLLPNDVLFVPSNKVKTGLTRALDSVISVAVGRAIYLR